MPFAPKLDSNSIVDMKSFCSFLIFALSSFLSFFLLSVLFVLRVTPSLYFSLQLHSYPFPCSFCPFSHLSFSLPSILSFYLTFIVPSAFTLFFSVIIQSSVIKKWLQLTPLILRFFSLLFSSFLYHDCAFFSLANLFLFIYFQKILYVKTYISFFPPFPPSCSEIAQLSTPPR